MLLARASKPGFTADGSRGAEPLAAQHNQAHMPRVLVVVDDENDGRMLVAMRAIHAGTLLLRTSNIPQRINGGVKD